MRFLYFLILVIFLGAIGLFAFQNRDLLTVTFWRWSISSSTSLLIILVYLIGMVSGWTVVGFLRRSLYEVRAPYVR